MSANFYEYESIQTSPSQNEETTSGFWNSTSEQSSLPTTTRQNPSSPPHLQRDTIAVQMPTSFDNLKWTDEGEYFSNIF